MKARLASGKTADDLADLADLDDHVASGGDIAVSTKMAKEQIFRRHHSSSGRK